MNRTTINWNNTNTILDETADYYLDKFSNINESIINEFDKSIKSILKGINIEDYIRMNWCPIELSLKFEKLLSIKNKFYYELDNKKIDKKNNIEEYISLIEEGAKRRGIILSDEEPFLDTFEEYVSLPK